MPLPSASKLFFPHPRPTIVDEHASNLEQAKQWAERLPFFGPSATYSVFPDAKISTTSTTPAAITGDFTDASTLPTSAYPHSGGTGLYFPYQKLEDWTAIRVDIAFSAYTETASRFLAWQLVVKPVEYVINSLIRAEAPSSRSGGAPGVMYGVERFINPANQHAQLVDHLIVGPHLRGVWVAEFRWYIAGGAGTISMDDNDRMRLTFTECPPTLPVWGGDLP